MPEISSGLARKPCRALISDVLTKHGKPPVAERPHRSVGQQFSWPSVGSAFGPWINRKVGTEDESDSASVLPQHSHGT